MRGRDFTGKPGCARSSGLRPRACEVSARVKKRCRSVAVADGSRRTKAVVDLVGGDTVQAGFTLPFSVHYDDVFAMRRLHKLFWSGCRVNAPDGILRAR